MSQEQTRADKVSFGDAVRYVLHQTRVLSQMDAVTTQANENFALEIEGLWNNPDKRAFYDGMQQALQKRDTTWKLYMQSQGLSLEKSSEAMATIAQWIVQQRDERRAKCSVSVLSEILASHGTQVRTCLPSFGIIRI